MDSPLQPVTCSVVVPTRQRPGPLRVTLDSLSQQTEQGFEVIVVVDGEDPETRSLADSYKATFPLHWIFVPERRGQASARNAGAAAAESEILIFLDDDTRPVPDWIHHHLKHHRANIGRSALRVLRKVADFGLSISILRKLFFAVGGFDLKLISLDEDTDFGARLYNHGTRFTFEPEAIVHHHDTKDAVAQHYAILRAAGKLDVYRRCEKKQCNGRLQLLAQMHCGSPLRKLAHRAAWHVPWAFQLTGSLASLLGADVSSLPICGELPTCSYVAQWRAPGIKWR